MAKFLRLHIRGIRSVGDEDHNVHKIEFLSPCTLISGPNGTGKTTTIEALNYVTTGQMPTVKKAAFIHSTDVARKTRVDASVALEFIDVKGRKCTAVRKLVAMVGTKNTAQAEEHTLTIQYADGTSHSLSSKVCDFNKAVLHHLGVPKAIFKYVIFCHQEDSTWPLSESKTLKLRFDEIFQLTKFVKAQERMRKVTMDLKKERQIAVAQQQLYEAHVKEKLENQQIKQQCIRKIVRGDEKLAQLKEQKEESIQEVKEMSKEITKLENIMIKITQNQNERVSLNEAISMVVRIEPYSGTMEELEQEIHELQTAPGAKNFKEEWDRIERRIKRNNQEKDQLTKEKRDVEGKISSLKAESIHRETLKKEFEKLEDTLRSELEMDPEDPFDLEVDTAISTKVDQLSQSTRTLAKEVKEIREKFDSASEVATKLEVELRSLHGERKKLEGEVDVLKTKIKQGENATSGMKDLLKKEDAVRKELDALPELDEAALKDCKRKRELVQKEVDDLKILCVEAEKHSEREKEVEALKKSLVSLNKKMAAFDAKHEENWDTLFGMKPEAPLAPGITQTFKSLRNDKKQLEAELRALQLNVQKFETTQEQQKKHEGKLTSQELQLNEEIFDSCCCEPEEIERKLVEIRKKVKKARKELAPVSSKVDLYDTWIENTNSSGCCPLCDRDFSTKKEVAAFSQKLQDMTLNVPNELEELEKALANLEKEEAGLVKAEGQARELEKVMAELKDVREKSKATIREMKEEAKSVEKKEAQLETLNARLKVIEEIQQDVGVMDQLAEQISDEEKKLRKLNIGRTSGGGGSGKSYLEIRKDVDKKELEFRKVVQAGEELQKAAGERNRLQAKLNELGSHRVSLGETAAQAGAFSEQLERKRSDIEKCLRDTHRKREEELPDARFKKEELARSLSQKDEERKKAEMEMQLKKKDLEQKYAQWTNLQRKIEEGGKNEKRKMNEQEQEVQRLNEKFEENTQRAKRFEDDRRTLNGSHDKQQTLLDQLQRMKIEQKLRSIDREIAKLEESGITEELVAEKKRLRAELQNDMTLRNNEEVKIYTQVEELKKQLNVAEKKLKQTEIDRSLANYRDAILEMTLLEESIADLEKYRKCLDVSLIQFHTEKMSAVNVIIDELWRKVYNSTDITTIRIRSDAKSETSARNNCAYDYNVMMVQESGAEVEMRGRCSAGQKMLASLLIRIALAEVFGGLCSMIALDEPTTNLDESKVDGMANVLNDLIEARRGFDEFGNRRGREMQMVVITHDERLVNKLTIGCRPEYIYCLGKDEHGVSYLCKRMPDGEEIRVTK